MLPVPSHDVDLLQVMLLDVVVLHLFHPGLPENGVEWVYMC